MWDILKQGTVVVCLRTPPEYHLSWFSWMLFSTLQKRTNRVEQQPHSTLLHVPACLVVAHPPFLVTPPSCFFFFAVNIWHWGFKVCHNVQSKQRSRRCNAMQRCQQGMPRWLICRHTTLNREGLCAASHSWVIPSLWSPQIIQMSVARRNTQTDDKSVSVFFGSFLEYDKWNLPECQKPTFCADNSDSLSFFFYFLFVKVCVTNSCEREEFVTDSCAPVSPQTWQPFGRSWWSSAMELVGKHVSSLFSAKTSFLKSTSQRCLRTTSLTLRWTESRFVLYTTKDWCNNRKATLTVGGGLTLEFPGLSHCTE